MTSDLIYIDVLHMETLIEGHVEKIKMIIRLLFLHAVVKY